MKLGGFSVPLIFDISNRNLLIWANGTLAVEKPPFKPFVFKEDPRGDIYIDDYKRKNVLVRMIKFKDFVEYKNFVRKYTDYQNAGLFAIPNVKLLYYAMSPDVILNYPQTDELKILTFDIEVETESGKVYKRGEKPIISIAAKINDDEPICFMNYDKNLKYPDTFIIRSFVDFFAKADPDIVVTYTDYDLVYLSKRMKKIGLQQHVLHRGNQPESRDIIFSVEDEDRIDIEGRLYFDVFVHVLRDQNLYGLRNRGLKEVSKFYKVATSDMIELTKDELGHTKHLIGTEKLEMYNKDDVIRTWGLFKVYFQNVINLAELLQVALNDAHKMLTKTSDIASLVMFRELARKNIFPLDTNYNRYSEHVTVNTRGKPRLSYEGAVVGMYKKPGLYAPIKKQDFSCLVSDTRIVTKERGTIKICDVKEGEHVLGIDGWHKIAKVWEFDYDGEIYDIHGVKCTPIHKFPVVKKRGKGVSHKMYDVPANELKLHKHVLTTYVSFENHNGFVTIMDERISVTKKEKSYYKGKVYDLTLEGRPYYYANKVLVHNSFYPNTAATFNLSPETVELLDEKDYTGNYKFWREGKYLYIVIPDKNWNKDIYIRIDMSKQGILTKHFIDFFKMKQSIKKRMKEVTDKNELERLKGNYIASKVLVNSLYGNMGLVYSRFGDAIVALATTGMCRYITTKLMEDVLKDSVIETDSVTGDTPVFVKDPDGNIDIIPIESLHNSDKKRVVYNGPYKILTRHGWRDIIYTKKHMTKKNIYRIRFGNGYVDVTEDHSLFDVSGKNVSPMELNVGSRVEIYDDLKELKIDEYFTLNGINKRFSGYKIKKAFEFGEKAKDRVPLFVLNSRNVDIITAFIKGFLKSRGIEYKNHDVSELILNNVESKTLAAGLMYLLCKLGYRFNIHNVVLHKDIISSGEKVAVYDVSTTDGSFINALGLNSLKNTDGWYLIGDVALDDVNKYIKNLIENEFGLTNYLSVDEEHYDSGYFYKAKNYILKDGDKYVIHGAVFKSSSKPLIYRKVFEEAIDFIFNNPNATEKEKVKFRMKVTDMSRYEWPNDFIMSIKTSAYKEEYVVQTSMAYKLIDQYEKLTKERVRPGDTISYVVVGNREFKVLPALKDSDRPCREYYIEMLNKLMEILMLPTSNRIKLF